MRFIRVVPVLLALLLHSNLANAATFTWMGGTNQDWGEPSNWDQGSVPGTSDDVTITPSGFQPVTLSFDTRINQLVVEAGGELRLRNGIVLQVLGDMAVKGTVSGGGLLSRVEFLGSTLENLGTISIASVEFVGSGTQKVGGAGAWIGRGIRVGVPSMTTLATDVTMGPAPSSLFVVRVLGSLTVEPSLTLTLESGQLVVGDPLVAPGDVNGAGTLRTRGASDLQLRSGNYAVPLLVANGLILSEASIPIAGSVLVQGTLDFQNQVVTVTGFPFTVVAGGVLKARETAIMLGSALVNRGRIEPGASPGRFVVQGALNQQINGAIEIEIAGLAPLTGHDRLVVTGNIKMRDTLRVKMVGAYTPAIGDEFRVLSFGSRNATFQRIVVIPGNPVSMPQFAAVYDDTSLKLVVTAVVGVLPGDEPLQAPSGTILFAPEPNPTTGRTSVSFELASTRRVRLEVFDAGGRRVRVLADETLETGRHERTWDGRNQQGDRVVPGVYLLRLDAGPLQQTKRVVIIGG